MIHKALSPSAQKVQVALDALGLPCEVRESPTSTWTAEEAARAMGCTAGQIAKSLVFRERQSGRAVLVIASGANRVNEERIGLQADGGIERARPDFVRQTTGFAIGGVPPVGHPEPLLTFLDEDLNRFEEIWAAAGTSSPERFRRTRRYRLFRPSPDRRRFAQPLDMAAACRLAEQWWTAREIVRVFPDDAATWQFLAWMQQFSLGRKRLLDALLAATYRQAGVRSVLTTNPADFAVFGVFTCMTPTATGSTP
jgi:prolyl-tRNA editing enzyme YbaK/EbsC (Cys-tRNA(Pro) deacylase)